MKPRNLKKVIVYRDERWPDYGLSEDVAVGPTQVEITEEFWQEYLKAEEAYGAMQEKLRKLYYGS